MGNLSCTSKIIKKLLTVIFGSNNFQLHGTVSRQLQIRQISSQHGRFLPFPFFHNKYKCCDKPEAFVKVIIGQSKVFGGNGDGLKRVCKETLCLLNSWVVLDKFRSQQARRSRDCNSYMKFNSYNSHKISRRTFSGGSIPKGYSLPRQIIGPVKMLCLSTPGYIAVFGKIRSKAS